MREHEYYQELMSRLLDEGLTDEEQTALREHMRTCQQCQRMGAAFTGMTSALRDDLAEPPADLARGVMERIRYEEQSAAPRRRTSSGRRLRPWVRLAAAACLVLLVAGVSTVTLRGRAKSSQQETADAAFAGAPETQTSSAGAGDSGGEPVTASLQDGETASGLENAARDAAPQAEEDASVYEDETVPQDPAPSPSLEPLPVYDAARSQVGSIAPENIPAFEALITDGGWAEGSYEYMLKVEYRQKNYAFAAAEDGSLVWWEEPSTQPLHSPGTFEQLRALITMDAAAVPQ